jgi:prevent-host-death family protein
VRRIPASKFKEQCLAILEDVDPDGIVITKHGRPVATLLPFPQEGAALIGSLKNEIKIHGDLLSTSVRWNAEP